MGYIFFFKSNTIVRNQFFFPITDLLRFTKSAIFLSASPDPPFYHPVLFIFLFFCELFSLLAFIAVLINKTYFFLQRISFSPLSFPSVFIFSFSYSLRLFYLTINIEKIIFTNCYFFMFFIFQNISFHFLF